MVCSSAMSETSSTEDNRPCAGVREDLKACLLATECVRIHRKTPRECLLTNDPSIPQECHALRTTFFECKRSLLDNRQRFRGRKGY
ncbi:cytochrome c oxidase assembly factor 5 isoform X2 [Oratosquilla oratoria]|uniref:cytochrome c oxidase assembly factor 5 isoform X2 n=1 Tax=Oratosquilla oratoria TaxID=337810 RepID=UPI003F75C8FE